MVHLLMEVVSSIPGNHISQTKQILQVDDDPGVSLVAKKKNSFLDTNHLIARQQDSGLPSMSRNRRNTNTQIILPLAS